MTRAALGSNSVKNERGRYEELPRIINPEFLSETLQVFRLLGLFCCCCFFLLLINAD